MMTISILLVTIGLPLHLAYIIMTLDREAKEANDKELSRWD